MKQTDVSQLFSTPFGAQADSTTITTIPQSKPATGRASMLLGFSKDNGTPIAAGGTPPFLEDMNGILNMLASSARAAELGLLHPFSASYASAIGGYPAGSTVAHPTIAGRFLICTQDNNTAAPPGNGWIDPLSDFVTNEAMAASLQQEVTRAEAAEGSIQSALQQEVTRAEAAEAAILQLPAWVPIPCPLTTAPTGFLPADGRSFNTSQYPQLAVGYPNGVLPDLRGMFLRGLDTTGAVDNVPGGRQILSFEDGTYTISTGSQGGWPQVTANNSGTSLNMDVPASTASINSQSFSGENWTVTPYTPTSISSLSNGYGVTRPKNVAYNYIFRAA